MAAKAQSVGEDHSIAPVSASTATTPARLCASPVMTEVAINLPSGDQEVPW